jgi:UDP-sugar pyrophosphorylase
VSGKCYLETYTDFLKGIADRSGGDVPPLVIMTSGDTDELTRKLLEDNDYYGLRDSIEVIMQDKVPAIVDVEGR